MDPITVMTGTTLGVLGGLAAIVNIVVQLIKDYFPKVPTKIVTIIVAIIVCIVYTALTMKTMNGTVVLFGIFGGLIVSYAAMNGFDTIKELSERFTINIKEKGGEDDEV